MRAIIFLLISLTTVVCFAQPIDMAVIEGTATLSSTSSKHLTINASNRAILHWKDFSIGRHEKVQFLLPSVDAAILNRVTGSHKSLIHGQLLANGQVILLNPNGILIGPKSRIEVGELIASTLDLLDTDFLKGGDLVFKGTSSQGIVNYGTIRTTHGSVILLGHSIENHGTIYGSTQIGTGEEILLKPENEQGIFIRAAGTAREVQEKLSIEENPYRYAIRQEGTIDALAICHEKGRVILKTQKDAWIAGTIRGNTEVFASRIEVMGHIEAPMGRIELKSEVLTRVGEKAKLCAHSENIGNGGKILLFSEGLVDFRGTADVRGGRLGGNGGWIEASGLLGINLDGTIDRCAPHGYPGSLVLDPEADLTISRKLNYHHDSEGGIFIPLTDVVNINIDTLLTEVQKGPVTITSHFMGEGYSPGSIILCDDIDHSYESIYPLMFHSEGKDGIKISGSLRNKNEGDLFFSAPYGDILQTGQIETRGSLTVWTEGKFTLSGTPEKKALLLSHGMGKIHVTAPKGLYLEPHAHILTEQGDLFLQTAGPLCLMSQAEIGNFGKGDLTIQGWQGKRIESIKLHEARIKTSTQSGSLFIDAVCGDLIIESSLIQGGIGGVKLEHIGGDCRIISTDQTAGVIAQGALDMTVAKDLYLDARQADTFVTANKMMRIHLGNNLIFNPDRGNAFVSSLQSIYIHVQNDMVLNGRPQGAAWINGQGISISVGGSVELFSNSHLNGGTGPLFVSAGKEISLSNPLYQKRAKISSGQLHLHSGSFLTVQNDSLLHATQGPLVLEGDFGIQLDHTSQAIAERGYLHVVSSHGNIQLYQNSELTAVSDAILLKSGKSLILEHFAKVKSFGRDGTTIVVDERHFKPGGGLIMGASTSIETAQAPLRIFTTSRHLNSIEGNLNGYKFSAAPLYFSTSEEKWGVTFPSTWGGFPFTIFHQNDGLIAGHFSQKDYLRILVNFIGPYTAELFRDLHPYDAFISQGLAFQDAYEKSPHTFSSQSLSSYDVLENQNYFIRTRTFKHINPPFSSLTK